MWHVFLHSLVTKEVIWNTVSSNCFYWDVMTSNVMVKPVVQEAEVWGCKHPQRFWFGENPWKVPEDPWKIRGNLGKLPDKTGKNGAQRVWFEKNGAKISWRPFIRKTVFMTKSHRHWPKFAQKWPKKFLGKFAEIRTKILPTPQVCLLLHQWVKLQPNYVKVSTPGSSTYVLNFSVFLLLTFCHLWWFLVARTVKWKFASFE